MKKLFIAILWIISVFLIFGSIGGFISGEITIAIILLAIGVFLLPPVLKKLFGKKKKEPSIELQRQVKDVKRIYDEIKQGYYPQSIQNQGLQILESLNILSTTKNIDTLKGRYEFINQLYDNQINASLNKRFLSDMQKSIDQYKSTFYERIPSDHEISLLIEPNKENLRKFYAECIMNCFKGFLADQEKQMETLKKQDAKVRRIKKIMNVAEEALTELKNMAYPQLPSEEEVLQSIEDRLDSIEKEDKWENYKSEKDQIELYIEKIEQIKKAYNKNIEN